MADPVVESEVVGHHGDKLRRFYSEVLGWPGSPRETGVIAARGSMRVPLDEALSTSRTGVFYARVPDLPIALQRALAHGSQVLVPPTRLRDTVVAVVSDPAGRPVGLCNVSGSSRRTRAGETM